MEDVLKKVVYVFIAAVVISALLLGLRQSALTSAYDSASGFTINDSSGVVHTVEASGISGDTVATLYALGAGLVWLIAIIAIVLLIISGLKSGRKG
jgi:hypothetical protein